MTMYADQKAKIAFSPNRRWAIAGIAIRTVNATPETKYPRWSVVAVMSPAAVPRAKVAMTVSPMTGSSWWTSVSEVASPIPVASTFVTRTRR